MQKIKNILIISILTLVLCASCDLMPSGISKLPVNDGLEVNELKISDDKCKVSMSISLLEDLDSCVLDDTTKVVARVHEISDRLVPWIEPAQPSIVNIRNVGPDELKKLGVNLLVLVDMTLPQYVIEQQRRYLNDMHTLFSKENMYVAFMLPYGNMSPVMPVTDYVLNNYFKPGSTLLKGIARRSSSTRRPSSATAPGSVPGGIAAGLTPTTVPGASASAADDDGFVPSEAVDRAYLFRSVSGIIDQINTTTKTSFDSAAKKALVVLSDGLVYDEANDIPLDPEHFHLQEKLIKQSREMNSNTSIFYVQLSNDGAASETADATAPGSVPGGIAAGLTPATVPDASASGTTDDNRISSYNILRMLCTSTNGRTESSFKWIQLERHIMESFGISHADYIVELENPEGKYFFGDPQYICLFFYDKNGKPIASCYDKYKVANVYNPAHIGDLTVTNIAMQGILVGLFVLIIIYVTLQLIVPYYRYKHFRKKYVIDYRGTNMSFGKIVVPDTCYYCKAPFEPGDKIVVKCQHVMHEECWDENEGHCPEYSETASLRHAALQPVNDDSAVTVNDKHTCQEGSHFYDRDNHLNPRNATFYMKWILLAIFSATVAWSFYVMFHHSLAYDILLTIVDNLMGDGIRPIVPEDTSTYPYLSSRQLHLLVFGSSLAFFITLTMSALTTHHKRFLHRSISILLRSVLAYVLTYIIFLVDSAIVAVGDLYDGLIFLDWISWTLSAFIVVFCCLFRSRCRFKNSKVIHIILTSSVSTILWWLFGDIHNVMQVIYLIFAYIVFSVGIALTIARRMPQNDHSFLNVTGPIKSMDIALYKWLRQSPDAVVTIGRSVECSLQISWDFQSDISPVHAKIYCDDRVPYIMLVEGDLTLNGKDAIEEKAYRLYHGDTFVIGQTVFKYIEM